MVSMKKTQATFAAWVVEKRNGVIRRRDRQS